MKLTLDEANVIADQTLAKARDAKYRPMCVAVLDEGGCLKVLKREDAASILRPDIAIGKAWGAVGMGESSRSLSERLKERPAFLGALSVMSQGKVVPVAGGVLIMDSASGNEIIGAVGVSGGTAEEDEACAIAGIKAAGFAAKS
ncbi:MAG: heme-binding protein [Candidatus Binatota bacterium]|nr:heme-binding protein [Candidatus Binatota bacterium]